MQQWNFDQVQVTQQQTTSGLRWLPFLAALFSPLHPFYDLVSKQDKVYAT